MARKPSEIMKDVLRDATNAKYQLEYANALSDRRHALAAYVKIRAKLIASPCSTRLLNARSKMLDQSPRCWQWDNVLSLAQLPDFQLVCKTIPGLKPIHRKLKNYCNPPANESQTALYEETLGCKLPLGYREFLLKVANGVSIRSTCFYSIEEISKWARKAASQKLLKRRFPLSWRQLMGIHNQDSSTKPSAEFWESGYSDGPHFRLGEKGLAGLLPIGYHEYGEYFIVLRGNLKGVIWGEGPDDDGYQLDLNRPGFFDLPRKTMAIPVPALSAILHILEGEVFPYGRPKKRG